MITQPRLGWQTFLESKEQLWEENLMCTTYSSKVVQFARLWTSSSSQLMTDYFYETSDLLSSDLISHDRHSQSQCAMSIWKAPMSVWFGKFCFQNLAHLDITICRVTFYIWLAKMLLKRRAHNQRNHELGCSLDDLFQRRPKCLEEAGSTFYVIETT